MSDETQPQINFDEFFKNIFEQAAGTGDEELLKIAANYSRQITVGQMRAITFLKWLASFASETLKTRLLDFVENWLELKRFNNSDIFVMRALESISLRKFLGENAIKVNVEK
jgi:hypothetical protein